MISLQKKEVLKTFNPADAGGAPTAVQSSPNVVVVSKPPAIQNASNGTAGAKDTKADSKVNEKGKEDKAEGTMSVAML